LLFCNNKGVGLLIHYILILLLHGYIAFVSAMLFFGDHEIYHDNEFNIIPVVAGTSGVFSMISILQTVVFLSGCVMPAYVKETDSVRAKEGYRALQFREKVTSIVLITSTVLFAYADAASKAVCPTLSSNSTVSDYSYLPWVNPDAEDMFTCPSSCSEDCLEGTQVSLYWFIATGFIASIVSRAVTMGISVQDIVTENCPDEKFGKIKRCGCKYTTRKVSVLLLLVFAIASMVATVVDVDRDWRITQITDGIVDTEFKDHYFAVFVGALSLICIHCALALLGVIITATGVGDGTVSKNALIVLSCNRCCGLGGTVNECDEDYEKFYVYNQVPLIRFFVINSTIVLLTLMVGYSPVLNKDVQYPLVTLLFMTAVDSITHHDY
jgi:hypothetical protein